MNLRPDLRYLRYLRPSIDRQETVVVGKGGGVHASKSGLGGDRRHAITEHMGGRRGKVP